ncbi:MAG: twin-arginine translocase subunit TatC [candidate division WOR-3 bacterium]|nr:twin-arginine translocase subunit TatC [candidate division WOR-3 bacterium]MCX7947845.1 twin-arginine translocase subunit TatC [candidate division WOR-3 bacterium]MDW8150667.1 twin-arginine translocase subunit TatC [candidate division WOR-3 bacterium]
MREQTFWEHVGELRKRIIYIVIFLIPVFIACFVFSNKILQIVSKPIGTLYFFSPIEAFSVKLKLAFLSSIFMSFPFIAFQIWKFIEPALFSNEKLILIFGLLSSILLFYLGSSLSIFIITPIGVKFLMSFSEENLRALIRADDYLNFLLFMTLSFGLLFQIPIVMTILSALKVVEPSLYSKHRKIIILLIFIGSAIITPTVDAFSMLLLAIPLIIIYEIGIIFSKIFYKSS